MPNVVTHHYDPSIGACLNVCTLPEIEACRVLDQLRRETRPTLKPDYFVRRLRTEKWLADAAYSILGRRLENRPAYFFLGDFSHRSDPSRPEALVIPLSLLPADAISFTLGDSMSVGEQAERRIYKLGEIESMFGADESLSRFGFSNDSGFQPHFIEVQVWERSWLSARDLASE